MKFRSRKDIFFLIVLNAVCLLILLALFQEISINKFDGNTYIAICVSIIVIVFIQWILYGTNYKLTDSHLYYKSAFFKGAIPLSSITELIIGKTMWMGFKPATARKGIIVKFGEYSEIYISPDSNDTFVKEIKRIRPEIKITD